MTFDFVTIKKHYRTSKNQTFLTIPVFCWALNHGQFLVCKNGKGNVLYVARKNSDLTSVLPKETWDRISVLPPNQFGTQLASYM